MSILTDYYCFERVATKSKTRLDCTLSTASYSPLEEKRITKATKATEKRDGTEIGALICYYVDVPEGFGHDRHRKAGKAITIKGANFSSVYTPDLLSPYGFGDVKGTADALLFVFDNLEVANGAISQGGKLEVFIARGQARNRVPLYNLLTDGQLEEEIEELRSKARVTKLVTL